MTTDTAVTMEELEFETAELLPSRETLCAPYCCYRPCEPCISVFVSVNINICL